MGFLDKVKEGAGDLASKAKEGAEDLAAKAKEEARGFQLERDLGKAYQDLGKKAHELAASGAIAHDELGELTSRVDELQAQLAALEETARAAAEEPGER
jgi:hypothetical protein